MGDTDAPTVENPSENSTCDITKPSIDILKESKPSENIAIDADKPEAASVLNIGTTIKESKKDVMDVEMKSDKIHVEQAEDDKVESLKPSSKNKSDIFSLVEDKNASSTIFSVGGAPSKTIYKTTSMSLNRTSSSSDTIGSSSSRRNPVTGLGVNSKDEYKNKPTKRKDGNPLLGVGYEDDDDIFSPAPTSHRIPPGGHSKGLW